MQINTSVIQVASRLGVSFQSLKSLPIRAAFAALIFCVGVPGTAALADDTRHTYQCSIEFKPAQSLVPAKVIMSLITGASWKEIIAIAYDVNIGESHFVVDASLSCTPDSKGYQICSPVVSDAIVNSFAIYRMGVFVNDGSKRDGEPVYKYMQCTEL